MQGILSIFFLMAGFGKVSSRKQQHVENGHIKLHNHAASI